MDVIDLSEFIIEKEISIDKNNFIVIGKIKEIKAVIKIKSEKISLDNIDAIINKNHVLTMNNDVYSTFDVEKEENLNISIIYPADEERIKNIYKTYELNNESYCEYLNSQIMEIDNYKFINDKKLLFENENIYLYDFSEKDCGYWVAIFKNYKSIRDLVDYKILNCVKAEILNYLNSFNSEKYNKNSICMYFEYKGKEPYLILKVQEISHNNVKNNFLFKFIFLDEIIKNLMIDKDYYKSNIQWIKIKE